MVAGAGAADADARVLDAEVAIFVAEVDVDVTFAVDVVAVVDIPGLEDAVVAIVVAADNVTLVDG